MTTASATSKTYLFEKMRPSSAVMYLAIPTVLSQIVHFIYSLADTFFIGQIGDPNQVAAISISFPLMILLGSVVNLLGMGAASYVSRCLGAKDYLGAKKTACFSLWSLIAFTFFYGLFIHFFKGIVLPILGANSGTFDFCDEYVFWTLFLGGIPTMLSLLLAHLFRARGFSKQASFGLLLGTIINIILDPIFIVVLDMQIKGAGIATFISNVISVLYFLIYHIKDKKEEILTISFKYYSLSKIMVKEVFFAGLPSALMSFLATVSNATTNKLISGYANEAIAGVGIGKRIDVIIFAVITGISQGVIPLIGYNYAQKNFKRMKDVIKFTLIFSVGISSFFTIILFTMAGPVVSAFIDDTLTVEYGKVFQKILCIMGPFISVTLIIITIFQAVGEKVKPLILSLIRKGVVDIPLMFILNHFFGLMGIIWATPLADFCSTIFAIVIFVPFWKKVFKEN